MKKSYGLSAHEKRAKRKGRSTLVEYDAEQLLRFFLKNKSEVGDVQDSMIDYSDIPELTLRQMKKAKRARAGRPPLGLAPKKLISIKIDPILLEEIKRRAKEEGNRYQTLMHRILEEYIHKHAA